MINPNLPMCSNNIRWGFPPPLGFGKTKRVNISSSRKSFNGEFWKEIKRFPNFEVSNLGRVRNKENFRIISQYYNESGYPCIFYDSLTENKFKKPWSIAVHRMVLNLFFVFKFFFVFVFCFLQTVRGNKKTTPWFCVPQISKFLRG
jgi:hypothetical protein